MLQWRRECANTGSAAAVGRRMKSRSAPRGSVALSECPVESLAILAYEFTGEPRVGCYLCNTLQVGRRLRLPPENNASYRLAGLPCRLHRPVRVARTGPPQQAYPDGSSQLPHVAPSLFSARTIVRAAGICRAADETITGKIAALSCPRNRWRRPRPALSRRAFELCSPPARGPEFPGRDRKPSTGRDKKGTRLGVRASALARQRGDNCAVRCSQRHVALAS
jgi:hypothetical protein